MRGLQKSKRVSWASDVNLCQVRLFLSEESPSQVGQATQDHLQAKTSWLSHPAGTSADDILPPGFEGGNPTNHSHIKLSDIPSIKWKCPPRVILDLLWRVAAGEESKENEIQNQREMRVLEAVFPHPSAIPPNPIFSLDAGDGHYSDELVPMIPITPVEDEDSSDLPPVSTGTFDVPSSSQSQPVQGMIPNITDVPSNERLPPGPVGAEPDVVAAAFAVMKSNEQGSLIDPDLLIKLLNNPKLVEKLVQDCGAASNPPSIPNQTPPPPPVSVLEPSYLQMNGTETKPLPPYTAASSGPFFSQPNGGQPVYLPSTQAPPQSVPVAGVPQVKDMNYYKNLIQQHGGEKQEAPHQYGGSRYSHHLGGPSQEFMNHKPRDLNSKPKIMKPCIYFNTARGCRHGANCAYQHDAMPQQRSSSIQEVQGSKRMKMDREISS